VLPRSQINVVVANSYTLAHSSACDVVFVNLFSCGGLDLKLEISIGLVRFKGVSFTLVKRQNMLSWGCGREMSM
jgi:hypothetical protein